MQIKYKTTDINKLLFTELVIAKNQNAGDKNEAHILFINKYNYANNDNRKWEPYTQEFFKY